MTIELIIALITIGIWLMAFSIVGVAWLVMLWLKRLSGERPLLVTLTMPLHWATRGWLKRHCLMCCEEGDEPHVGLAAVMTWFRDRKFLLRIKLNYFRHKHPRFSKFLCRLGKHEAFVLFSEESEPGTCVACRRVVKPDILDWGEEE